MEHNTLISTTRDYYIYDRNTTHNGGNMQNTNDYHLDNKAITELEQTIDNCYGNCLLPEDAYRTILAKLDHLYRAIRAEREDRTC